MSDTVAARTNGHVTVEGAIDRIAEAAQGIVAGQIEVTRLDVAAAGGRMARGGALVLAGAVALAGAWTALTLAIYVHLASQLSVEQRLGLIGLAHGILGLGLVIAGARAMKAHAHD